MWPSSVSGKRKQPEPNDFGTVRIAQSRLPQQFLQNRSAPSIYYDMQNADDRQRLAQDRGFKYLEREYCTDAPVIIAPIAKIPGQLAAYARNDINKECELGAYLGKYYLNAHFPVGADTAYTMELDDLRLIDAKPKGNFTRFLNHSPHANVQFTRRENHMLFITVRQIKAGEQLLIDYGESYFPVGPPCYLNPSDDWRTPEQLRSDAPANYSLAKSDFALAKAFGVLQCYPNRISVAVIRKDMQKLDHLLSSNFCSVNSCNLDRVPGSYPEKLQIASAQRGITPLMTACYTHNHEAINRLLDAGADADMLCAEGRNALMYYILSPITDIDVDTLTRVVDSTVYLETRDVSGHDAIQLCVVHDRQQLFLPTLDFYHDAGIDPFEAVNYTTNQNAFHQSVRLGRAALIKQWIDYLNASYQNTDDQQAKRRKRNVIHETLNFYLNFTGEGETQAYFIQLLQLIKNNEALLDIVDMLNQQDCFQESNLIRQLHDLLSKRFCLFREKGYLQQSTISIAQLIGLARKVNQAPPMSFFAMKPIPPPPVNITTESRIRIFYV